MTPMIRRVRLSQFDLSALLEIIRVFAPKGLVNDAGTPLLVFALWPMILLSERGQIYVIARPLGKVSRT